MRHTYLKTLRTQKGLTQRDLAFKCGVSTKTVGLWEAGLSIPSEAAMVRLSRLFDGAKAADMMKVMHGKSESSHTASAVGFQNGENVE